MSKTLDYPITSDQRDLVTSLWNSDEATQGRPQFAAERVEPARDYLSLLLVEGQAEVAHIELLQELYGAKFRYPLSRRFWQGGPRPPLKAAAGFRHHQLLPEQTARAVAERGPGVLSHNELAVLLLNPYAVWDLADLIDFLLPDYWLGRMEYVGRELMDRHGLDVPIPGIVVPSDRHSAERKREMNDPLEGFDWATLYSRYDDSCSGYDPQSPHLARFDPKPLSDRELYYRLIDSYRLSARAGDRDPLGTYQALLYWKLYSQPAARANIERWMSEGSKLRRLAKANLPKLLAALPLSLERRVQAVVEAVKSLSQFQLPGMSSDCALPVRTTFLHFVYPSTVPIFDKMVLRAVGITAKDANKSYAVLQDYLPFAWELADRYSAPSSVCCNREEPLRRIDMALWVNRGSK